MRRAEPSAVKDEAVAPEGFLAGLHELLSVHRDRIAAVKETVQRGLVNRKFGESQRQRAALPILKCNAERLAVGLAVGHERHKSVNGLRELVLGKRQLGEEEKKPGQSVLAGFRRGRVGVSAADLDFLQCHMSLLLGRRTLFRAERRNFDF